MKATDFTKIATPEEFWRQIPRSLEENIQWRMMLHEFLDRDTGAQKVFQSMCVAYPPIFFDAVAWTLNPKKRPGSRNWPFILRDAQIPVVWMLKSGIDNGHDVGIEKSREEGATELCMKLFCLYLLCVPETQILIGSRTEDEVEKAGDRFTLMAKADYTLAHLPPWWRRQLQIEDTHLHLGNKLNNSCIDGEATSLHFGASNRATAVLLDEFGRTDYGVGKSILGSVNDVTNCVIFSSTHWLGMNHPFNQALQRATTKVVRLPWWENPEKSQGLYRSPEPGIIEIIDIDYYRRRVPEVFDPIQPNTPIKYREFEARLQLQPPEVQNKLAALQGDVRDALFVADGCLKFPKKLRSPWHDYEEIRRDPRDLMSNGSADAVFPGELLSQIKAETVKDPAAVGEVEIRYDSGGHVTGGVFRRASHTKRFKWWGDLEGGRPNQKHNYAIG
ncbi:MAG: hypothetical protein JRJ78_17005 [Deltaproteobacteria bacterium]|nr:hypothetical protein [Deltaproteobacteria bacterium]